MNLANQIARASLEIGAIKLRSQEPFIWASGYQMPIYNDNRMLLGSYQHRKLVTDAFTRLIVRESIGFDMIAGTSTAGIAPATGVAQRFDYPLVILHEGEPYIVPPDTKQVHPPGGKKFDLIASNCPWGIPAGVVLANESKSPFIYVRDAKKKHGLQKQIEGRFEKGQAAVLIEKYVHNHAPQPMYSALDEAGLKVVGIVAENIAEKLRKPNLHGKQILVIEDLISTGSSSAKEVKRYQELGATVKNCISIFDYGLDAARAEFSGTACDVHSILTYDMLLDEAVKTKYISENEYVLLQEWRNDPFTWGERNGFPRVQK